MGGDLEFADELTLGRALARPPRHGLARFVRRTYAARWSDSRSRAERTLYDDPRPWIQAVAATNVDGSDSRRSSSSAGISPAEAFAGRALSSAATSSSQPGPQQDRSVPLGKYLARQSVGVFAGCRAARGCAGRRSRSADPVASVILVCNAISLPWSQVERPPDLGYLGTLAVMACARVADGAVGWHGGSRTARSRVARSTTDADRRASWRCCPRHEGAFPVAGMARSSASLATLTKSITVA